MLIILSPSKTISHQKHSCEAQVTLPRFIKYAEEICRQMKQLSLIDLQTLLKTSQKLTQTAPD